MHDVRADVHTRYEVEIAVMEEMSWSYPDLCAAPEDMVQEILERRDSRIRWQRQKAERDKAKRR